MMHTVVLKRKTTFAFGLFVLIYIIYSFITNTRRELSQSYSTESAELKFAPKVRNWFNTHIRDIENNQTGPGEQGLDVVLTDPEEISLNDQLYQQTGFSVVVSDKISINRSLPDVVHGDCINFEYSIDLPKVSVIIIYHNEVKSVLLRTVHSVINRTPPELLHEVILVNDKSSSPELYAPLSDYVAKNFPTKVKIKNLTVRSGLIVTRMAGARMATGEVLVFFDSHVEVQHNWLPPLLQPIVENRRIATLPIIDYFDSFTFGYLEGQETFQGEIRQFFIKL